MMLSYVGGINSVVSLHQASRKPLSSLRRPRRRVLSPRCNVSSEESAASTPPPTIKRAKGQSLTAEDLLRGDDDDDDSGKSERPSERFMVVGSGEFECTGCGYVYDPKLGDPEYPVSPGTMFKQLPADWICPVCGAEPKMFQSKSKVLAGFAENQGYGLGTNSMTADQKSYLIWGSLLAFFALFLAGKIR